MHQVLRKCGFKLENELNFICKNNRYSNEKKIDRQTYDFTWEREIVCEHNSSNNISYDKNTSANHF